MLSSGRHQVFEVFNLTPPRVGFLPKTFCPSTRQEKAPSGFLALTWATLSEENFPWERSQVDGIWKNPTNFRHFRSGPAMD